MKITLKNVSDYYRGVFVAVYEENTEYYIKMIDGKVYFDDEVVGDIREEDLNKLKELEKEEGRIQIVGYEAKYNEYQDETECEFSIKEEKEEHEINIFL